jgi:hypothetical protein
MLFGAVDAEQDGNVCPAPKCSADAGIPQINSLCTTQQYL